VRLMSRLGAMLPRQGRIGIASRTGLHRAFELVRRMMAVAACDLALNAALQLRDAPSRTSW